MSTTHYLIRVKRPEHPLILVRATPEQVTGVYAFEAVFHGEHATKFEQLEVVLALVQQLRLADAKQPSLANQKAWAFKSQVLNYDPWLHSVTEEVVDYASPIQGKNNSILGSTISVLSVQTHDGTKAVTTVQSYPFELT